MNTAANPTVIIPTVAAKASATAYASNRDYIGYEYLTITTDETHESVLVDGYQNFGWRLEDVVTRPALPSKAAGVTLKFKRDRNIINKAELSRLQRQFESQVKEIDHLERSAKSKAGIVALILGMIGCALLAGATFSYLAAMIVVMIALAAPDFACWIAAWPAHHAIANATASRNAPTIEHLYDMNDDVCRKANGLLK